MRLWEEVGMVWYVDARRPPFVLWAPTLYFETC